MHLRGAIPEVSLTDTLHIAWAAATLALMLLTIASGAAALGKRFRAYSAATVVIFLVFGTLTGLDGPRIAANLPTPRAGIWERINIAAFMGWLGVFSLTLFRGRGRDLGAPGRPAERTADARTPSPR
jgi:hypothetical protein